MVDAPNPRSLRAAREQRKLDLEEVADYTKISAARLEDFESGLRAPSLKQIEGLARLYNVPSYLLYLDATPNLELVLPDFRRPNPRPADLSPGGLVRLWAAERIAVFAKQLCSALSKEIPSLLNLPSRSKLGAEYAAELRSSFDDWLGTREDSFGLSGPPEFKFLAGLRLYYEAHGCISLINEAPPTDYFGFYNEPAAGLNSIFVNRSISSKKAQLFTFVHELGHSILRKEGVSNPFETSNATERACNSFAANFLAPKEQFSAQAESLPRSTRDDIISYVRQVSSSSLLSHQATAIRLYELGYISDAQHGSWQAFWREHPRREKEEEKEGQSSGGPGAFAKQLGELGCLTVYLAGEAVRKEYVGSLDIQRGLGLSESVQAKAFDLAKRRFEVAIS